MTSFEEQWEQEEEGKSNPSSASNIETNIKCVMLDNPKNDAKSEENSVHDNGNAATSELEETWVVIMCLY